MGQLHRSTVPAAAKSLADRAGPLLDSAEITHDQRQARTALHHPLRRADGRCGQRHHDRRVPLAGAATQRIRPRRVDRRDGGNHSPAGGHLDRRGCGGLPGAQTRFDDLRHAVGPVGGRRPRAGADLRRARRQRRRARRPRRARCAVRSCGYDGARDDAARGGHAGRLDAGPREQRVRGGVQPLLHRRARRGRPDDRHARRGEHHVGDRGRLRAVDHRHRDASPRGRGHPEPQRAARGRVGRRRRRAALRLEQQGAAHAGDRRPRRDRSVHADGVGPVPRSTSPTATSPHSWAGC